MEQDTINSLIKGIVACKREETRLSQEASAVKKERHDLEYRLLGLMQKAGTDTSSVRGIANARIETTNLPQVKDWEAFYDFLIEQRAPYLLQRRVTATALAELANLRGEENPIPGIEFYEKTEVKVSQAVARS